MPITTDFALASRLTRIHSGDSENCPVTRPGSFGAGSFAVRSPHGGLRVGDGTEDHPHGLGAGKIDGRAELDRTMIEPMDSPGFMALVWPSGL
jgi:hypothetical protein